MANTTEVRTRRTKEGRKKQIAETPEVHWATSQWPVRRGIVRSLSTNKNEQTTKQAALLDQMTGPRPSNQVLITN